MTARWQSFETQALAEGENFAGWARINPELICEADAVASPQVVGLDMDMDSTGIPVQGHQELSGYGGRLARTCYHPPLVSNAEGDCLAAKLRRGHLHSAEGWEETLLRAEAAFAKQEIYEALEEWSVKYAMLTAADDSLGREIV